MSDVQNEKLKETVEEVDGIAYSEEDDTREGNIPTSTPSASELEKQRKNKKVHKTLDVQIKRLEGCDDLPLPQYATSGACAMDLYASETKFLRCGDTMLMQAGISIALPEGFEAQIRPRSGLALKHGISIVNSPGTIDSDYRGPIGVILINHGRTGLRIDRGMRIAQMVVQPVTRVAWQEVDTLDETDRGEGGFGHTGN